MDKTSEALNGLRTMRLKTVAHLNRKRITRNTVLLLFFCIKHWDLESYSNSHVFVKK